MQCCGVHDVAAKEFLHSSAAGAADIVHVADESMRHREGWDAAFCHFTLDNDYQFIVQWWFACIDMYIHCVSEKNDNDVLCYNFNAHQPILIIFGRDIAE